MKTLYNFIAIIVIAGIFVYSCGDDNPTGNNNNNGNPSTSETLRVTHDSIAVYSRTSNYYHNTVYTSTSKYNNYHITFTVETNVDTCCPYDSSYLKVMSLILPSGNPRITHINKTRSQIPGTNVNTYFTLTDTSDIGYSGHSFNFGFSEFYPPGKFIRIKNLRVYTVH